MEYKKVNSGATVNGLTMANFEVRQGRIYLAKDKRLVAVNQK